MRRRMGLARLIAAALALSALTGCVNVSQLAFTNDDRLSVVSPDDRALVTTPFTIQWRIADFRIAKPGSEAPTKDAGYFAIFLDRAPVKPGKTLRDVAKGDSSCKRIPTCPDQAYLADRGVFTTTGMSLQLDVVPALASKDKVQLHSVIIILLDTEGRRIGESAWRTEFKLRKRTFS